MQLQKSFTWLKLAVAAMAFTMALPASAAICDQIQCTDQIATLYVSNTPITGFPGKSYVYVGITNTSELRNLNCTLQPGNYLQLQPDNPGYDKIFSVLQAYMAAKKPVKIRVNTPSANCSIAYVVVTP